MHRRFANRLLMGLAASLALVAASAHADMAPWEKALYEAAKKEQPITVYTAHYDTETAQNLCLGFEKKYPGLKCNFVRVTAADDVQAAGAAVFLRVSGVRRVFVLDDGTDYGATLAKAFVHAAEMSGAEVLGRGRWEPGARDYALLAKRVKATGVDGVYLAGAFRIGSSLLVDLRRALGPAPVLLGSDGFQIVFKDLGNLGREVDGLYVTALGVPLARLGPAGRGFVEALTERIGRSPELFSVETAAAAEVMLDAIARSRGTRASVTEALLATRLDAAILGPVAFTASGDVRRRAVTIHRITGGHVRVADVVEPPTRLLAGG